MKDDEIVEGMADYEGDYDWDDQSDVWQYEPCPLCSEDVNVSWWDAECDSCHLSFSPGHNPTQFIVGKLEFSVEEFERFKKLRSFE